MPAKNTKNVKKQTKPVSNSQRSAQILFAIIAVVVILSMVFSTLNF
jgi:hypothetical protein